jgi:hypothetical protein
MFSGWYEAPTQDGTIVVRMKKSGIASAHEIVVKDWDYTTAQKLIDDFVATGHYPVD